MPDYFFLLFCHFKKSAYKYYYINFLFQYRKNYCLKYQGRGLQSGTQANKGTNFATLPLVQHQHGRSLQKTGFQGSAYNRTGKRMYRVALSWGRQNISLQPNVLQPGKLGKIVWFRYFRISLILLFRATFDSTFFFFKLEILLILHALDDKPLYRRNIRNYNTCSISCFIVCANKRSWFPLI